MNIDIKTSNLQPRRQTYSHVARRLGSDRPASRYEEATLDVQATANFHYRPLWQPEFELYDPRRTAVRMEDWYALRDPRQFYYGTYNISRAGMNQVTDGNFAFVEKRDMLSSLDSGWAATVRDYLIPMRHYEWGTNMNNMTVADQGYGTAVTAPAAFCGMDRLGMAQIVSRIGLALDGGDGASLDEAKTAWMEAPHWQGVRRMVEDSFVVSDWFEVYVAQNLAMDGIMHPLVFNKFDAAGREHGGAAISMLSEFMVDWFADNARWVDAVIKTAAKESGDNAKLLSGWFETWTARAVEAAKPLAAHVLGEDGEAAVDEVAADLNARAAKLGIAG